MDHQRQVHSRKEEVAFLWENQRDLLYFFIIKPTRCTNFPNLLRHETPHVPGSSTAIIRSLFTVHSALVYVIQVCRQLSSRIILVLLESCLQTCMTYNNAECTVNKFLMMAEELPEICRVSCRSKLGKLVHLVGFIINKFVTMYGHTNLKKNLFYFQWNITANKEFAPGMRPTVVITATAIGIL
jgi:hypothetical protein